MMSSRITQEHEELARGEMAASSFYLFFFLANTSVLILSSSSASAALCDKDDKKALLAIKAAFHDAYFFTSWTENLGCCDWNSIECSSDGRITALALLTNDLSGTIPDAVGDLPFLGELILHHLPNLVGTIPPAIAKLKRLRFLTISWTNVTGTVPSFLSQLPALEELNLSFNNLSGSIPASLGDHPSLISIDISRNKLTGSLPPTLFRNATTQMPYLVLSHNSLSGEVPPEYGNVGFVRIDLSRNLFAGDASVLFGRSKPLQQIDLSRNTFEFDLTELEFPEDAILLDINHNKVYGSIPKQIVNVTNLQFFNVSYNRLCGEIPSGGSLGSFDEYCYLHNKCLCGSPLPPCK